MNKFEKASDVFSKKDGALLFYNEVNKKWLAYSTH